MNINRHDKEKQPILTQLTNQIHNVVVKHLTCLFRLGLIHFICSPSFILRPYLVLAESKTEKHVSLHCTLQAALVLRCLYICDNLSEFKCSLILVDKWREVL